jgi:hypothetical protein
LILIALQLKEKECCEVVKRRDQREEGGKERLRKKG